MTSTQKGNAENPTLKAVQDYYDSNRDKWNSIMECLDRELMRARDGTKNRVPIYLTKARIKTPNSAFLKLKRKHRTRFDSLTDWLGFRVLCLFRQDVVAVFPFLLSLFFSKRTLEEPIWPSGTYFLIKEIKVYNWLPEDFYALLDVIRELVSSHDDYTLKEIPDKDEPGMDVAYTFLNPKKKEEVNSFPVRLLGKGSGYQSIHFVTNVNSNRASDSFSFELQLRTLLQDVWGELEHALSYKKGKIHPHISNSFLLLAKELQGKDVLVSQLRTIKDQETAVQEYAAVSAGPKRWISYDNDFVVQIVQNEEQKKYYDEYVLCCKNRKRDSDFLRWPGEARERLSKLTMIFGGENLQQERYFAAMEEAFILFAEGRLESALSLYKSVIETDVGRTQWFPYFRLGEVSLAQDKTEDALVAFDLAEAYMQSTLGSVIDRYFAKVGMAYVYWSLGMEFIDFAIEKMEEGEKIVHDAVRDKPKFNLNLEEDIAVMKISAANNLCYYFLEKWISTPGNAGVGDIHSRKQKAKQYYDELLELEKDFAPLPSNSYDTMAWYNYQVALHDEDINRKRSDINKAVEFLSKAEGQKNIAPSRIISSSLQREHMQIILCAYKELGGGATGTDRGANNPTSKLA